jgi:alkanesulfonate monooxygenase SsuD/methylene tetrahydromethanopterin reductase-like flavin-dependent oxidoreductase (luciferase family)
MTRWGALLPTFDVLRTGDPPPVTAAARLAELLEFDSVWAGDHLACPAPALDAPTCLAAAAAATETVSIGMSVMLLGLRAPAWAAKQLTTLQVLSGGRLRLGVGVGGEFPQEFAAAGIDIHRRGARLDAILSALPDLLGGRPAEHVVGDSRIAIPPLEPSVPMPPVLVGGRSDAALRRAARFGDSWLPMWISPGTLARRAERLAEYAAELGRPRPSLAILIGVRVERDTALARREAAEHLQGLYRLPLETVERWTLLGDHETIAERLQAYVEAGVGEFVLMPLGGGSLAQIERLAEAVSLIPSGSPHDEEATA